MDISVILQIIGEIKRHIDAAKSNSAVAKSLQSHLAIIEPVIQGLSDRSVAELQLYATALTSLTERLTFIKDFLATYKVDGQWYDFLKLVKSAVNQKKLTGYIKGLFEDIAQLTLAVSTSTHVNLVTIETQLENLEAAFKQDLMAIQAQLSQHASAAPRTFELVEDINPLESDSVAIRVGGPDDLTAEQQALRRKDADAFHRTAKQQGATKATRIVDATRAKEIAVNVPKAGMDETTSSLISGLVHSSGRASSAQSTPPPAETCAASGTLFDSKIPAAEVAQSGAAEATADKKKANNPPEQPPPKVTASLV